MCILTSVVTANYPAVV